MADDGMRPIVVKRVKKVAGGHHGGAWKIAYADFVTAMMAFFLLMWLLGSTSKTYDLQAAKAALERQEAMRLESLKAKIESIIEVNPLLKKYKNQLLLDITSEGLRIQIVDEKNRPMFALAKAELQPYTREILHVIGMVLNEVPNKIGLSGHTDSTPYYSEAGYSNWELSADRANASRREMVQGGLGEDKVLRVVGLASAAHLDRKDPFNPINRRISIIVMNKRTEEAVMRDAATLEVPAQDAQTAAAGTAAAVAK